MKGAETTTTTRRRTTRNSTRRSRTNDHDGALAVEKKMDEPGEQQQKDEKLAQNQQHELQQQQPFHSISSDGLFLPDRTPEQTVRLMHACGLSTEPVFLPKGRLYCMTLEEYNRFALCSQAIYYGRAVKEVVLDNNNDNTRSTIRLRCRHDGCPFFMHTKQCRADKLVYQLVVDSQSHLCTVNDHLAAAATTSDDDDNNHLADKEFLVSLLKSDREQQSHDDDEDNTKENSSMLREEEYEDEEQVRQRLIRHYKIDVSLEMLQQALAVLKTPAPTPKMRTTNATPKFKERNETIMMEQQLLANNRVITPEPNAGTAATTTPPSTNSTISKGQVQHVDNNNNNSLSTADHDGNDRNSSKMMMAATMMSLRHHHVPVVSGGGSSNSSSDDEGDDSKDSDAVKALSLQEQHQQVAGADEGADVLHNIMKPRPRLRKLRVVVEESVFESLVGDDDNDECCFGGVQEYHRVSCSNYNRDKEQATRQKIAPPTGTIIPNRPSLVSLLQHYNKLADRGDCVKVHFGSSTAESVRMAIHAKLKALEPQCFSGSHHRHLLRHHHRVQPQVGYKRKRKDEDDDLSPSQILEAHRGFESQERHTKAEDMELEKEEILLENRVGASSSAAKLKDEPDKEEIMEALCDRPFIFERKDSRKKKKDSASFLPSTLFRDEEDDDEPPHRSSLLMPLIRKIGTFSLPCLDDHPAEQHSNGDDGAGSISVADVNDRQIKELSSLVLSQMLHAMEFIDDFTPDD